MIVWLGLEDELAEAEVLGLDETDGEDAVELWDDLGDGLGNELADCDGLG